MSIVEGIAMDIGASGSGVDGLTYSDPDPGGNVFLERLPKTPHRAVGVYSRPGPEASALHPYDEPHVQIIVRSDEDPLWAINTWWEIYSWVQARRNVTLPDGTYLVSAISMQSGPVHMDLDENGRYRFSMNIRTEIKNPTVERPE